MANLTVYKGKKYYVEIYDDKADLYATNGISDDNIKGLSVKELDCVYRARIWVNIRGCEALYNGIVDGFVLLDVRPSNDVEVLEAKQVDRDVYHAKLSVSEIESMWEERMPYLDFPYPDDLPTREEIEIPK